jgi:hypothetical protein
VSWCGARGVVPEWDHGKAGTPFYAWVWGLGEQDRLFAKLRWG